LPIFSHYSSPAKRRDSVEEEDMKFRLIAAAGLVTAFVTPALAADEFYVAQDVEEVYHRRQEADRYLDDRRQSFGHRLQNARGSRDQYEGGQGLLVELIGRARRRSIAGLEFRPPAPSRHGRGSG
jgi:hypothetical protein